MEPVKHAESMLSRAKSSAINITTQYVQGQNILCCNTPHVIIYEWAETKQRELHLQNGFPFFLPGNTEKIF